MQFVVESRCHLYPSTEIDISDIDDVRNGILLRVDLHRKLGHGMVAFLKVCDKNAQRRCLLKFCDF